MTLSLRLTLLTCACLLTAPPGAAATVPAGFSETLIANGLAGGTAMALAPDGRIFVCEKGGRLRVIKNNALLATPFATLPVNAVGERGLLGVALDPAFSTNGFVYVYYTTSSSPMHNRVVRFTAAGDVAAGGETLIFRLNDTNAATNHNGGALHFGPDGKLYIATGDNTTGSNSQSLANLFGKILRINPDGTIPADNPFSNTATGANRAIWALGLRNPFTFAFDPDSPRMFINDVGQNTWEEINEGDSGANFGWPTTEGSFTASAFPNFKNPRFVYGHGSSATTGCAITGGAFYPTSGPFPTAYRGKYFFGDYCGGWLRVFDPATGSATGFATGIAAPLDLAITADGALLYLAGNGIFRVAYSSPVPVITAQPQSLTRNVAESATFSVTATGAAPLTYQWQRDGLDIPNATASSYTIPSVAAGDDGSRFRVRVRNSSGDVFSNEAVLIIGAGPSITAQPQSLTRIENESATFAVTATGNALTYQWQRDNADLGGATAATYTLPNVTLADNGARFRVRIRNANGDTVSNEATLTVNPAIVITSQPQSLSRTVSESAAFSVTATGAGLTYQWQRNGADLTGATAATYAIANVSTADNGARFRVRLRTSTGSEAFSNEAALTVTNAPPPTITAQPQSLTRIVNESAAFSVIATGTGLTYQWQRNGADLTGATSATYTIPSVALTDNGARFRVRIRTSAGGEAFSNEATLTVNPGAPPVITSQPQSLARTAGQSAAFSVTATGTGLTYQWQRNGADLAGATSATYTLPSVALTDNGARFRVRIRTSAGGEALSNEATLTVNTPANRPPTVTILAPATGLLYSGGMQLAYSASATDPEDGPLPASAFSWTIVFHHDNHTHPFLDGVNGVSAGSVEIPNRGETATNVFFRIQVTVRDSQGLTATATRDVLPQVVTLRIESNFNPVRVTIDGQPAITPVNLQSVAGMIRAIGAPLRQKLGTNILRYVNWSDGGEREHEIVTPAVNTVYRVTYR